MLYMVNPQNHRFFYMVVNQDLFGTWCINKTYGGLKNNHCRNELVSYENQAAAYQALTKLENLRRKRGYIYANIQYVELFSLKPQTIAEVLKN